MTEASLAVSSAQATAGVRPASITSAATTQRHSFSWGLSHNVRPQWAPVRVPGPQRWAGSACCEWTVASGGLIFMGVHNGQRSVVWAGGGNSAVRWWWCMGWGTGVGCLFKQWNTGEEGKNLSSVIHPELWNQINVLTRVHTLVGREGLAKPTHRPGLSSEGSRLCKHRWSMIANGQYEKSLQISINQSFNRSLNESAGQ